MAQKRARKKSKPSEKRFNNLKPSDQAAYRVNLMLAEVELAASKNAAALEYLYNALRIHFTPEAFNKIVSVIEKFNKSNQHHCLFELGKITMSHRMQFDVANDLFNKLSRLNPEYLKKIQEIMLQYKSRYHDKSKDHGTRHHQEENFTQLKNQLSSNLDDNNLRQEPHSNIIIENKRSMNKKENDMQIAMEDMDRAVMVDQDETGIIDKDVLSGLMDSLMEDDID